MDDSEIIRLYWNRDEEAIFATAEKYAGYCTSIAKNICESSADAEECVNDTYLAAWNSIPPQKPSVLSAFLGRLARNISLNKYKYNTAAKRGGGAVPAVLDELLEIVSDQEDVEQEVDRRELIDTINHFLSGLPAGKRQIFVRRYWYFESISVISTRFGKSENHVSVLLHRLRKSLREELLERGFSL